MAETLLQSKNIEYLSISNRVKGWKSLSEKIARKGYKNGINDVSDLSGIRIIVFFNSQIPEVEKILSDTFDIISDESSDRGSDLGRDKLGYRSFHLICKLGQRREKLPEYNNLHDLKFEIQIRTVLQHAWAQLAHDSSYKFSAQLPTVLERQLNLYSGLLEIADNGFDEISKKIDSYKNDILSASAEEYQKAGIDSIAIARLLEQLSKKNGFQFRNVGELQGSGAVSEIRAFGISSIGDLEELITDNFLAWLQKWFGNRFRGNELTGGAFLRLVMMYTDLLKYFNFSWQNQWSTADEDFYDALSEKYGKKVVDAVFRENKIIIL